MLLLPLVSCSQNAFLWLPSRCSLPDSVLLLSFLWGFCVCLQFPELLWIITSLRCFPSLCTPRFSPLAFCSFPVVTQVFEFSCLNSSFSFLFVLLFYAFYLVQFTCLLVCFTFLSDDDRKQAYLLNRCSFNILFRDEEMAK